ncbi:glycine receptor subunit alpha-3 [Plakobranchus ocellatus]|uniref:Glycine receptor subunit alpha-3 n=1 Tax=Plakobranchus ocellatus TaxID=259542 RepID=A0AAV3Y9A2_9GAST|nr:glycine receptor subunit alpha-3 [Plakobranchus ocellatus]
MTPPADIFQYFSKIDLSKGYWQIPVRKEDIPKTAFVTMDCHYEFLRISFGMMNSGATLTRAVKKLLDGMDNVVDYIDDLLIHTETWEAHVKTLSELFKRLQEANFTARPVKCLLGSRTVDFLGHSLGRGAIGLQNENVEKGQPNIVNWGDSQERAYNSLKVAVTSKPVLQLPDVNKSKRAEILTQIIRLAADTYDDLKTTPPTYDTEKASKIKVLLYVSSIDAVNEASMDFTVGILLHLRWEDKRIYHNKAHVLFDTTGIESLDFDPENINKVWVPDIFFPNEKKGSFHEIMIKNQMMRMHKGGTLLYISRLSVTLSCPMNLINYPFDKQTCHLIIMSSSPQQGDLRLSGPPSGQGAGRGARTRDRRVPADLRADSQATVLPTPPANAVGYSDADVQFEWMNKTEPNMEDLDLDMQAIILDKEVALPQFEVKKVEPKICRHRYHQKSGNHSCLQADFQMSRNIGFYIVQMYIPSTLIVMLSWISFWLTVNSVPGRISLGLLTVLTMTTQMSSVNAALPRVSYTKAIDVWMSACLVFVFAALLEFAIVNVLSRKDSISGFSLKHVFTIPKELLPGEAQIAEVNFLK